ncbi:glycosyltransferase family 4 protein [Gloeobacter kilaueensis]|uniref:Glycosyl transferase group 1 n=1 Tax=Gloeobacter kilaueensis (strain ATCC BAA-2537 / CCAP 1431/1 / ULC 316 / JS1) TaxID=1183438 RepID=U5QNM2_GLOK1|nr:glycosyltransferase family 4 protein [Gloeobacter kilaueensis]AGY60473.1 glycosyl transferase group 1 [Gloeobacter kilaueensis JS1]
MSIAHILFYDDIGFYGGHQAMTVRAATYLATKSNCKVSFVYNRANERLARELKGSKVRLYPSSFRSTTFVANLLSLWRVPLLQKQMRALKADLIVVAQGRIEQCMLGLLAARLSGERLISYLPLAHDMAQIKRGRSKIASALVDAVGQFFYRLPEHYIVPDGVTQKRLQLKGVRTGIAVVPNGIDTKALVRLDRYQARTQLGLAQDCYWVGLIGRILFAQKGQDFLVESVAAHRHRFDNIRFLLVGDGPDSGKLQQLIERNGLADLVYLRPWSDEPAKIYSALDLVVMPSFLEGLPLVMLEAMGHGLPVVASAIDAMAEILPEQWLFACGDGDEFVRTLLRTIEADNGAQIARNRARVLQQFDLAVFEENFYRAILAAVL